MSAVVFPLVNFVKYTTAIASKVVDSVHKPITSTPAERAAAKKTCPVKVVKRSPSTTSLSTESVYASSTAVANSAPPHRPLPVKRVTFVAESSAQSQEQEQEREAEQAAAAPAMLHIQPNPEPTQEMIDSMENGVYMARSASDPGEEEPPRRGWYEPVSKGKQSTRPRARSASPHYAPPSIPLRRPARIRFLCKLLFAPLNVLRLLWTQLQRLIYGQPTLASDHNDTRPLFESVPDPRLMKVVVGESSGLLRREGPARITLPHEIAHLEGPAPSPDRFLERQPAYDRTPSSDSLPTRSSSNSEPVDQSIPEPVCTRIDGAELLLEDVPVEIAPATILPSITDAISTDLPESRASSVFEQAIEEVETVAVEDTAKVCEVEESDNAKITETVSEAEIKLEEPEVEEPKEEAQAEEDNKLAVEVDYPTVIEESVLSPIMEESETTPPTPAPQLAEIDPISMLSEDIQAAAPEVVGVAKEEDAEEVAQQVAEEIPKVVQEPLAAEETVLPSTKVAVESPQPTEAMTTKVEIPSVTEEAPALEVDELEVDDAEPEVAAIKSEIDEPTPVESQVAEPAVLEVAAPVQSAPVEAVTPENEASPAVEPAEIAPVVPAVTESAIVPEVAPVQTETESKPESLMKKRMSWIPRSTSSSETPRSVEEEDPMKDRKPKRTWTFQRKESTEAKTAPSTPSEEKKRPLLRSLTLGMAGKSKESTQTTESTDAPSPPKLEKRMSWLPKSKDSKTKSAASTGASSPVPTSKPASDAGSHKEKPERRLTGLFRKSSHAGSKDKLARTESFASIEPVGNTISALTPPILPTDVNKDIAAPVTVAPNMPPTPPHSINITSSAVSPAELVNKLSDIKAVETEVSPVQTAPTTPEKEKKAKARWMGMKRAMTLGNIAKKK